MIYSTYHLLSSLLKGELLIHQSNATVSSVLCRQDIVLWKGDFSDQLIKSIISTDKIGIIQKREILGTFLLF